MSRNNQAYQILKDLVTNHCHLRCDEIYLIMEFIFRHLNHDEDDTTDLNQASYQQTIKVRKRKKTRNQLIKFISEIF